MRAVKEAMRAEETDTKALATLEALRRGGG
jgi:hypothetical protein